MSKNFLRNEKEVREESRETLDYLNNDSEEDGFFKNEFKKLRELSSGIL